MNITVTCKECKGTFGLTAVDLKEADIVAEDGAELKLTFYTCPECKKRYTVMVDNADTLRILADYTSVCSRLRTHHEKHKNPPQKLVERMFKLKQKLLNARNRLNKRYDKSFYQIGDAKEQLEISVPATNTAG